MCNLSLTDSICLATQVPRDNTIRNDALNRLRLSVVSQVGDASPQSPFSTKGQPARKGMDQKIEPIGN